MKLLFCKLQFGSIIIFFPDKLSGETRYFINIEVTRSNAYCHVCGFLIGKPTGGEVVISTFRVFCVEPVKMMNYCATTDGFESPRAHKLFVVCCDDQNRIHPTKVPLEAYRGFIGNPINCTFSHMPKLMYGLPGESEPDVSGSMLPPRRRNLKIGFERFLERIRELLQPRASFSSDNLSVDFVLCLCRRVFIEFSVAGFDGRRMRNKFLTRVAGYFDGDHRLVCLFSLFSCEEFVQKVATFVLISDK